MSKNIVTTPVIKEAPAYIHADLPQSHNPALNFYAVYLEYWDGTQSGGAVPCLEVWGDRPFVLDHDNPYTDPGIDYATNVAEFSRMENKRRAVSRNKRNAPKTRYSRGWQHIIDRGTTYYEDQDVAAATDFPFVRAVSLFCPAWGPAALGIERHGIYFGLEEEMANHPSVPGKPGYCPKCAHSPEQEAEALKEMAELYRNGQRELPEALATAVGKQIIQGGLV